MTVFALFLVQCLALLSTASKGNRETIYPELISQDDEGITDELIDGNETSCVDINGHFKASLTFSGIVQNLKVRICSEGRALSTEVEIRLKSNDNNVKLNHKSSEKSNCFLSYYSHPFITPLRSPNLTISINEGMITQTLKICEIEFFAEKASTKSDNTLSSTVDYDLQSHFSTTLEPEWTTADTIINATVSSENHNTLSSTVNNIQQHTFSDALELEWSTTEPIVKTTDFTADEPLPNSTNVWNNNQQISRTTLIVIIASSVVSVAVTILVAALFAHCIHLKLRKKSARSKDTPLFIDTKGSNFHFDLLGFENSLASKDNQIQILASRETEDRTKLVSSSTSEGNLNNGNFSEKADSEETHSSQIEANFKDNVIYGTQNDKAPCVNIMVENEIYAV